MGARVGGCGPVNSAVMRLIKHLKERANEISTVDPGASVSSYIDRPYGPALLRSQPSYFSDAQ